MCFIIVEKSYIPDFKKYVLAVASCIFSFPLVCFKINLSNSNYINGEQPNYTVLN